MYSDDFDSDIELERDNTSSHWEFIDASDAIDSDIEFELDSYDPWIYSLRASASWSPSLGDSYHNSPVDSEEDEDLELELYPDDVDIAVNEKHDHDGALGFVHPRPRGYSARSFDYGHRPRLYGHGYDCVCGCGYDECFSPRLDDYGYDYICRCGYDDHDFYVQRSRWADYLYNQPYPFYHYLYNQPYLDRHYRYHCLCCLENRPNDYEGLDDESMTWTANRKFGRSRMRKLGRRVYAKLRNSKNAYLSYVKEVKTGSSGKHGVGVKHSFKMEECSLSFYI